ncbi:hypothetical protein [Flavisolibacter tropicus]|uniref:Uncharacterized protein n=1 Tax=Flavisolibacter tropicus TaxID=1492898 RepID=A0A172U041_9BACT|nr:hypothetical protein [Flavisolibacter tropicus]ANE52393.1 hypothetical protein SY85_19810 [Flavisolibacter tropicus]
MNHQRCLHYVLGLLLLVITSFSPVCAQDFRVLTPVESAYFKKVNDIIRKTMPTQIGTMKLVQMDLVDASTTEKTMLAEHPKNKGPYRLGCSIEYGKTIDQVKTDSKLEEAINKALNDGNEAKERELNDKMSQVVSEQRCRVDIMINYDLLNFNYVKGKVIPMPIKDAVAYRSLFTEDVGEGVTYLIGTYVGVGEFKAAKNQPFEGTDGGVFEAEAKKEATEEMTIENVVFRIYAAPAIADQLIKQMDIAGLKAILGKKLTP